MTLPSRRVAQLLVRAVKDHNCAVRLHTFTNNSAPLFNLSAYVNQNHDVKRLYTEDRKTLLEELMKVVKHAETPHGIRDMPPRQYRPSQEHWTLNRRVKHLLAHFFSDDGHLLPTVTVEEQLKGLMQIWELEEAVKVLKSSMSQGYEPDSAILLNLLQQLANMGEVDCLSDLYEFLKDRNLTTSLRFFHCLRDAYFNSGRIEEGVDVLRIIYHSRRDFNEADLFFTLLTTMIIEHFEHRLPLIESFVEDLEMSDPPVPTARAALWRCLVLAEKFEEADAVLVEHKNLKKMVPEQVTRVVQSSQQFEFNKDTVLPWLLNLPFIKSGLKASVFDMLIQHKSHSGEWSEALDLLSDAMEQGMKVHQVTVQVFLTGFLGQLSPEQVQQFSDWANKLEECSDTSCS